MRTTRLCGSIALFFVFLALPLLLAAQNKKYAPKDAPPPSYEAPQPVNESLDLAMYQLIR